MDNITIIFGIALVLAFIIIMNIFAVKYIRRIMSVKDGAEVTKGVISEFDNIHSLKVEYTVNDVKYSGECCVLFVKGGSSKVISGKKTVQYAIGDEVDVRYNVLEPSKFLIDGGKEFYKARAVQIFFLDAAVLGLAALLLFMHFYLGL